MFTDEKNIGQQIFGSYIDEHCYMYLYVMLSVRKYVRNVTVLLNISSKTPYPWDSAHVTVLHFTLDSRNVKPFFVDPYSLLYPK